MEDAEQFLSEISKLSRALLIEMPHPDESKVCGKQVLKTQLTLEKISQFKQSFNKLSYQSDTHCDPHLKRFFLLCRFTKLRKRIYFSLYWLSFGS